MSSSRPEDVITREMYTFFAIQSYVSETSILPEGIIKNGCKNYCND